MFALCVILQQSSGKVGLPGWLTSGPIPIIALVALALVVGGVSLNFHLKRIERRLHKLGKDYYSKDQEILDKLKAGLITEGEYRKQHQQLLQEMRDIAIRLTDGPPK
jgi:uncharacterized membrane protein